MIRWHKNDLLNRMYINIGDGKKAAMPRYFKNKIYSNAERSEISGFQKGQIEIKTLQEIHSYEGNASYARDKNQSIKAEFRKMYHNNSSRQKL